MARKKTYKKKSRKKSRAFSRNGGITKAAMDGFLAGIAPVIVHKFAGNMLGNLTGAVSLGAVGYFRKNNTLVTLAAMDAARAIGGGFLGNGNGNGSGFFE